MRTYKPFPRDSKVKRTAWYKDREATEWDVRLDVSPELTAETIVENAKACQHDCLYVMVSGVEFADKPVVDGGNLDGRVHGSGSTEDHVHIGVITLKPVKRADVLAMLRGPTRFGAFAGREYCTPRNAKWPYAGWVIHHSKLDYKIPGEPELRHEWGMLPIDPPTLENSLFIKDKLNKWGTPTTRERFGHHLVMANKDRLAQRIAELQRELDSME